MRNYEDLFKKTMETIDEFNTWLCKEIEASEQRTTLGTSYVPELESREACNYVQRAEAYLIALKDVHCQFSNVTAADHLGDEEE